MKHRGPVWRWILGAAVAITLSPAVNADPAAVLSLDEALKLAAAGNRQVRASQLDVERQKSLYDATAAQRLPKLATEIRHVQLLTPLNFNIAPGTLGTFPGTGPIPGDTITISNVRGAQTTSMVTLSQPLSQQYKLSLGLESQDEEIRYSQESERNLRLAVSHDVCRVYLSIVDLQNQIQATREALDFARELERVTSEYLKEKAVLKSDLLEVQASRAQQEYTLKILQHNLALQKQQLNHLLGRTLETDFQVRTPALSHQITEALDQLQTMAQEGRPDLSQARTRLKQASLNTEIERARYIPDVSLQFSYQNQGNSGLLPGTILSVGLVATWDIFDWGNRDASVAARARQAEAAQKQLEEAESKAALEVSQRFLQVGDLRAQEPVRKLQVEAAEEKHRVALSRYQVKSALTKDLLQSQADLAAARRNYQKWQLDLALAVVELYQAVGKGI